VFKPNFEEKDKSIVGRKKKNNQKSLYILSKLKLS